MGADTLSRNLSVSFIQTINDLEAGVACFFLVTFEHDSFASPIRIVNNNADIISRGDTFTAFAFDLTLSVDDGKTLPSLVITMDNISRDLIREIWELPSPPSMLLEIILSSDPDFVEIAFPDMLATGITYDTSTIRTTVTVANILNKKYPAERITAANYLGLFQ